MTRRHFGFTLAEVLITLGIIGVVAAMTMPTLINSTQGAQYKAAYKKALSAISQGVTLNVALDDNSFGTVTTAGTEGKAPSVQSPSTVGEIIGTRMNVVKAATDGESGYGTTGTDNKITLPASLKNVKTSICTQTTGSGETAVTKVVDCSTDEGATNTYATVSPDTFVFFNDGSMFSFEATKAKSCTEEQPCYGIIDVNGLKGPNKLVECDQGNTATESDCTLEKKHPTDIYPVVFYDQTILPASAAAKAVLYGK